MIDVPNDLDAFTKQHGLTHTGDLNIKFKDGTIIRTYYDTAGKFSPMNSLVRVKLLKGIPGDNGILTSYSKDVEVYSVIGAMPNIFRGFDFPGGWEFPKNSEIVYRQLYYMATQFIKLKDETFLTFDSGRNLIIRFDKNLKTKFKPQHGISRTDIKRNFFVIPYSVIEGIDEKVRQENEPWTQATHDRLLQYFEEQEKNGKFN